jgi:hypothetical protein
MHAELAVDCCTEVTNGLVEFEIFEVAYGGTDLWESAAGARLHFYVYNWEGGNYGRKISVSVGTGELCSWDVDWDLNVVVPLADDGKIIPVNLERAQKALRWRNNVDSLQEGEQ